MEPGERLMEIQLAQKLGVSRTPIREAIRKLELEGLVIMIPRKGAEVAHITEKDMKDVLEVRSTLEELVVELAIKNVTDEKIEELKCANKVFESAIVSKDAVNIVEADVKFHDILYSMTNNARLIQIINNLREQMYRYRLEYVKDARTHSIIISEHNDIITAEELGLGARAMIEEGALEGVDACFGMHVWSDYPAGTVALRKGPMMASGDQFKIHVRGKSTHGAQPQLGADALIMGAAIAQNLQTIVSRETYPGDTAVVTVGKFHSGTRFNVVAGTAELEGTTRTFSPAVRDRFEEQITRIARSTAEAMRGTADVEYLRIVPVTVNDPGMIDVVTGAAGKTFGDKGVIEADLQMGGEDFAFYQEKVPGAMVLLGVRNEACDAVWPQHHGCYKVDESVLVKGAALHVQTALDFLGVDLQ